MSVYVASRIQQKFHCALIEDEIGYLTLHLMNAVRKNPAETDQKRKISPLRFHHLPRGVVGCY